MALSLGGLILFLGILLGLSSAMGQANSVCKKTSVSEWQKLLNKWSDAPTANQSNAALRTLSQCESELKSSGLMSCFQNFIENLKTQTQIRGHGAGFTVSDRLYLEEMYKKNPTLLYLPEKLKDGLFPGWKDVAKANGWKFLEYRSWSIANPPYGHYSRVLFYIQNSSGDQWIQFTVPDDFEENKNVASLINVIGVDTKTNAERPGFAFVEYQLDSTGKNPKVNPFKYTCYSCHPSGGREIVPAPGSVRPGQFSTLTQFNQILRGYGEANFYRVNLKNLGNPMGTKQGCTVCHNHYSDFDSVPRGGLIPQAGQSSMAFKMLVEFSMPPSLRDEESFKAFFSARAKVDTLTEQESNALWERYSPKPKVEHNEEILEALLELGKISQKEHEEALEALTKMKAQQAELLSAIEKDYPAQRKIWLRGGRENCLQK